MVANPPAGFDPVELARLRFALDVRDTLAQRLDPNDANRLVWFDRKRLEPGDEWEPGIVDALHRCEGAVVLITPESLKSPWVLREATILADRRSRWPELRLIPVLMAGATLTSLATSPWWAALDISRWQPVTAVHGAFQPPLADADRDALVNQVVAKLAQLTAPRDPLLEGWAQGIRAFLRELRSRGLESRLSGAARALRLQVPLTWDELDVGRLARELLYADVLEQDSTGGGAVYPVLEAVSELVPGQPEQRPRNEAEKQLCLQMKPMAAPPAAAAAIGLARAMASGRQDQATTQPIAATPPAVPNVGDVVLFGGDHKRAPAVAELAVLRATCGDGHVRALTGVTGENPTVGAAVLSVVGTWASRVARLRKSAYVIIPVNVTDGDDIDAATDALSAELPKNVNIVVIVGRNALTSRVPKGGRVAVVLGPEDEDAALTVADDLAYVGGVTPTA